MARIWLLFYLLASICKQDENTWEEKEHVNLFVSHVSLDMGCELCELVKKWWKCLKHVETYGTTHEMHWNANMMSWIQAGWTSVSGRNWGHRKRRRVWENLTEMSWESKGSYLIRALFLWRGRIGRVPLALEGYPWILMLAPTLIAEVTWDMETLSWLFRTSMMTKAKMILLQVPRCFDKGEILDHSSCDFASFWSGKGEKRKEGEKGEKREEGEHFETQLCSQCIQYLLSAFQGHAEADARGVVSPLVRKKRRRRTRMTTTVTKRKRKRTPCWHFPEGSQGDYRFPTFCG